MSLKVKKMCESIKKMHKGQKAYVGLWLGFVVFLIISVIIVAAYRTPENPNSAILTDALAAKLNDFQAEKWGLINNQIAALNKYLADGTSSSITIAGLTEKVNNIQTAVTENAWYLGGDATKAMNDSLAAYTKLFTGNDVKMDDALLNNLRADVIQYVSKFKPASISGMLTSATDASSIPAVVQALITTPEVSINQFVENNVTTSALVNQRSNVIASMGLIMTIFMFAAVIVTVYVNGFVLKGKKLFRKAGK
ncbi:hypothetical protein [Mycoplasma hafezii]|uniref:hypothetical protein n=1 Tax=Mycoplasma hafezii TaxID=525886 RepID=UPI003CF89B3C